MSFLVPRCYTSSLENVPVGFIREYGDGYRSETLFRRWRIKSLLIENVASEWALSGCVAFWGSLRLGRLGRLVTDSLLNQALCLWLCKRRDRSSSSSSLLLDNLLTETPIQTKPSTFFRGDIIFRNCFFDIRDIWPTYPISQFPRFLIVSIVSLVFCLRSLIPTLLRTSNCSFLLIFRLKCAYYMCLSYIPLKHFSLIFLCSLFTG